MSCPACGHESPAHAKFCGECGAALALRCAGCGTELLPTTKFCLECGRGVGDRTGPAGGGPDSRDSRVSRKVVTIVFADLVGSTSLHERLDAEAVRQFMEGYYAAMRGAVEAHGGRVTQLMGDGVKAVFGAPRVAEDDAIRAVRAAVEMQRAFRALADEQRERVGETGLRVAVNTGEVVADDATEIIGDPVNVAARLQEQGRDGDVVIGGTTQRLVGALVTLAPLGNFTLKGRAEPVAAYRVLSLERPAGSAATPFVGRDEELGRLTAVYDAATSAPAARLAVLLGSPGLGKSRLLAELARQLEGRARVLTAQCSPSGGATFAPLAEALRAHFPRESSTGEGALRSTLEALVGSGNDAERAKIAVGMDALLSGTAASPEEIFFVMRRLLSALAAEQPVVLAIDDVQWAEPLLLDFAEHLVQWGAGIPLLVLVAARPELRDTRSSFTAAGGLVSDVVTLGGLDAGAAMRLAANVVGTDTLPATVAGRVLATSEGNPLFLRELVRMLVNDGTLRRDGERWVLAVDLAALEMPPTIQALLAARIERLRPEERLVLERASVVGRQFSRAAVANLLPREAHADLDARLEALRRSELIEADAGWLLGEPTLRFHHVLIRDAAYRRVLRGTRAELHARFADWLEARAGESVEHEEQIGWHLEQAHLQLRELGPLDASGRALGERAARRLAEAGRRALARDDLQPAGGLLGRALDCLGEGDPARGDLALDWCEALLSAGDVGTAARALAELGRFTAGSARLRAWHTCFTSQLAALADPKALRSSAEAVVAAAEALAAAGDVAGEAKAHAVHAEALARLGEIGACEAALDKALAAARRANDRRRANTVLSGAPLAALWGPSPVTRASGRCLDVVRVLRITQGAPAVEAVALRCQAVLETLRGRSEAARRMIASSRHLVEELGITQRLLEVDHSAGLIELFEGDAVAAERLLRPAYEGFRAHGLGVASAQTAALLGHALLAQGRAAEAEALSHESEALAGDDFQAAIDWRGTRALALAGRGEHAAALELAQAAVEIATGTDDLLDHAAARSALAVALRAAGRSAEADAEEARAVELWEQKGATLLAERARRGVVRVAPAERALDAGVEPPRPERRRVRPNAATAICDRFRAASAARDADALDSILAENFEQVLNATGADLGKRDFLVTWRSAFRAGRLEHGLEAMATLGDSLVLGRESVLLDGIRERALAAFGPSQLDDIFILEADGQGLWVRAELFAPDRLDDAIARLYERHAELLPEGPERTRAEATARTVAQVPHAFPSDLDALAAVLAPDVEFVDHRPLGLPSRRGAKQFLDHQGTLFELADDLAVRIDDVVALCPDALLGRWINSGTLRAGGGAFEREFLFLDVFGADGLLARRELFGADRVDEALARFDEVTAAPAPPAVRRRVRPNAATANFARLNEAGAARDVDAVAALLADGLQIVIHTTGVVLDRAAILAWWRLFFADDRDGSFRLEPLGTLGERLALAHQSWGGSASASGALDVGAFEMEMIFVYEADADGRAVRVEAFSTERTGDAVARLYERYAELLPEGPARERADFGARLVAGMLEPSEWMERWAMLGPAVEFNDRRLLGVEPVRGPDALLAIVRPLQELSGQYAFRVDDVFAVRSDALVVHCTNFGTERAGGGAYERPYVVLQSFPEGLLTHIELFDSERLEEALARFDELGAEPRPSPPVPRRVSPNAATAMAAHVDGAVAARDLDALDELVADGLESTWHPQAMTMDRQGVLLSYRILLSAREPTHRYAPLASLGDSLAIGRLSVSATELERGTLDVGAYEVECLQILEVDAQGRMARTEAFATDHLGDAVARLYERHAELLPEGSERACAAAMARVVAEMVAPTDSGRWAGALARGVELVDRRLLGVGSVQGSEAVLRSIGPLQELSDDFAHRVEDVLALRADASLLRWTNFGTDHASGGAYEREWLLLLRLGADGRVTRIEQLDADRAEDALARFDELTAVRPVLRRVRPNAATAHAARLQAVAGARDAGALKALFSDEAKGIEHPTGVTYDRRGLLFSYRSGIGARGLSYRLEPLATLGASLALCRESLSARGYAGRTVDVGAYERERIDLVEVDAQGRRTRAEHFAAERLGDAVVRLYERYAELLPEGAERTRSVALARSLAAWVSAAPSAGLYRASVASDVEIVDHRALVALPLARGASEVRRRIEIWFETIEGLSISVEDVIDLRADGLLVRMRERGRDRASGGSLETERLVLLLTDADGLLARVELFDADREVEALARFDELVTEAPSERIANAAWRVVEALDRAMEQRDWNALVGLEAPGYVMDDRRALVRTRVEGDASLANLRLVFDAWRSISRQLLATRGERLALDRQLRTSVDRHGGLAEFEYLGLNELDARGRLAATVLFDPNDLDSAYAELDARFVAADSEAWGLRPLLGALAARDWAQITQQIAPDIVWSDHRRLGLHEIRSREEYLASLRAWLDLVPDARVRTDHVLAQDGSRSLAVAGWVGTREGGPFEIQFVVVVVLDSAGRIREYHTYDLDQLDLARASYAELGAAPRTAWVANAATRFVEQAVDAWNAHDWERFVARFAPEFRTSDRRKAVLLDLGRDESLEFMRMNFELISSQQAYEVLATRGDRLALARLRVEGAADRDAGPSEIEALNLVKVNENGECVAAVRFDPDALDAAYAELDARYGVTVEVLLDRALAARDWDSLAAMLAPDLVVEDHRRLGSETLHGPAAFIAYARSLVDLAPDTEVRVDHSEHSGRGGWGIATTLGHWGGGRFEMTRVIVADRDASQQIRRLDFYDLEQLDAARARFEALAASAPSDPLAALVRPNAASGVLDRFQADFEARDWAAVRALAADGARFEDRRRYAQVSGDADWWLAGLKLVADAPEAPVDLRFQRTLVATAGERVCLEHVLWTGGPAEGRVEIEYLSLAEIDEAGRLVAGAMFDVDDRRAAMREASTRWLARDPDAAAVIGPAIELMEAWNDRDGTRLRAVLADDLVVHNHRLVGQGRVDGAEAHLDHQAVMWELAPDIQFEPGSVLALERHGAVVVSRSLGTLSDGGGAFDRHHLQVITVARGRVTRIDSFDLEQLDAALARLAELRPDPLRIPANAATRAGDRWQQAFESKDWDAVRALCAPITWEDRRPLIRTSGDCELLVQNLRLLAASGARPSLTLLATAGDRLALHRVLWRGGAEGGAFEVDTLRVVEVDAEGRVVADVSFDPGDRRAASVEMLERFARSGIPTWLSAAEERRRAILERDIERLRAELAEDFVFDDHRRVSPGRIEGRDAYVAWMTSLFEQSPDALVDPLYYLAVEPHAALAVAHSFGTLADGGAFENAFVQVSSPDHVELFELDDLDLARARFDALRPDPTRIPPNAASRARDRSYEAWLAGDWDALRALASPDFRFEDRSRRALVSGDVEMWLENNRFVQGGSVRRELIGTAGERVALERLLWSGTPDAGSGEVEHLRLTEVDADGHICASVRFDLDDRAAAFAEAGARFVAGEAAAIGGQAPILALFAAFRRRDWETMRGCLAEGAVFQDRRAPGILGTLDRDQWVESFRVLADLAPDLAGEVVRILAWNGFGRVQLARQFGTREGGSFESVFASVIRTEGDRIQHYEIFDAADADRALARFAELCADGS